MSSLAFLNRLRDVHVRTAVGLWLMLLTCGCAATPYHYGRFHPQNPEGTDVQPIRVDQGRPNATLDTIGWIVGIPSKILTFNRKTNNHRISPETLAQLKKYMEENDITDVYVAIDDYDPKGQWRRIRENKRIAPFWRYTAGTVSWVGYALLPNRIFGGDIYNPFANSLNLSSDVPALVLSSAAYAKDIHGQKHPGAYATIINGLPVVSVFRQARATRDVLGYTRQERDWKTEKQAYHVLYAQMGSAIVGTAGPLIPVYGPLLGIGGAVAGHATGRTIAYARESKLKQQHALDDEAGDRTELADRKPKSFEQRDRPQRKGAIVPASFEERGGETAELVVE